MKYYVVWKGRIPGLYYDWVSAKRQVDGYSGAEFKSFTSLDEAKRQFGMPNEVVFGCAGIEPDAIVVDGACSGKTGVMEYRGVFAATREEIFHSKYENGTNNIAEFLAIVDALKLCMKNDWKISIYSDSKIARGWVKYKTFNTSSSNTILLNLMQEAIQWLKQNKPSNKVLKWETTKWGENYADFGRK